MLKKFIASFGIITLLLFLLFLLLFKTIQKINNHYITKKNKNIFSKINMKNKNNDEPIEIINVTYKIIK